MAARWPPAIRPLPADPHAIGGARAIGVARAGEICSCYDKRDAGGRQRRATSLACRPVITGII